jgi:hypothetical protein
MVNMTKSRINKLSLGVKGIKGENKRRDFRHTYCFLMVSSILLSDSFPAVESFSDTHYGWAYPGV